MKRFKIFTLSMLCLILCTSVVSASDKVTDAAARCADYIYNTVISPTVSSTGGEWSVIALSESGFLTPDFSEKYFKNLEEYLESRGGILHSRKYTEYARVVLALNAIKKDPTNVGGYDLLTPLTDFDTVTAQGLNGAVWALSAIDSCEYEKRQNNLADFSTVCDRYIEYILDKQLPSGGFALNSAATDPDPDITGMALSALSKHTERNDVRSAVEKAVVFLSSVLNENGGYISRGVENPESAAQVLIGICAVGISADDPRFVKNGNTLIDNILSFEAPSGGFFHSRDDELPNIMSAEQALLGLAAAGFSDKNGSTSYDGNFSSDASPKRYSSAELFEYIFLRRQFGKEEAVLFCGAVRPH